MIEIIQIIALTGILLYVILLCFLSLPWYKKKIFIPSGQHVIRFASIIVAVRNEYSNLPVLLECLAKQTYPSQYFEVLLIDDHSTDGSQLLMQKQAESYKHVRNFCLPTDEAGKKAAIRYGVEHAKGELIITTDADCRMQPEWLSTIVDFQQATDAAIIIAPVAYIFKNDFFEKIQALEFASLIASGAFSASIGRPILCNGANLAFIKSVYPSGKPLFEKISPSGDDIFLLLHLKKTNPKGIHFLNSPLSIVHTYSSKGLHDFINQRKRWYAKSIHYSDPDIITLGIFVVFASLSLLLSLFLALVIPSFQSFFLWIFLLKLIADMAFLYPFLGFIKANKLLWLAPILEIIYPFYIFYIILSSRFGNYIWKNRKYSIR